MSIRARRTLLAAGVAVAAAAMLAYFLVRRAVRGVEPFLHEQAVEYLRKRFASEVELAGLHVRLPKTSPWRIFVSRGRGAVARVEGSGLRLRQGGRRDIPPLFEIDRFAFDVDLGVAFEKEKTVQRVELDGLRIHIPPAGERKALRPAQESAAAQTGVLIREVAVTNGMLAILPRDRSKKPLRFDLHRVHLESVGPGRPMKYVAELTNAKPPGRIRSNGTFGPWAAADPGATPLAGGYSFDQADLGVFPAIAGILQSTGSFEGSLDQIDARGEAYVPDFRLKSAGNRVPLRTRFAVRVDGTSGNTILQPVHATLGSTRFVTSGAVVKHEGDRRRSIDLDVTMPAGDMRDLLRLAVKGAPFMQGRIRLLTRLSIPPLAEKVREKLVLDGRFQVSDGVFLRSGIQDQIDSLSRRGQGEPKNEAIDEVVSNMAGRFRLDNEVLTFRSLTFGVPGAAVDLAGAYNLDADLLDLRGSLRLKARVSQTQTGWKRWALKPVDPFFAKDGDGTLLRIRVDGSSRAPKFGLDRGRKDDDRGRADRAR